MTYLTSPYQMNPFNHNPLKELLAEAINFERVRGQTALSPHAPDDALSCAVRTPIQI
jgi:hypothetical protein